MAKAKLLFDGVPIKEITDIVTMSPADILKFRKVMGYSQRELGIQLAKICGREYPYSAAYISNLENHHQLITLEIERAFHNLDKIMNTDHVFIFGDIQHHPELVSPGSLYAGRSKACKWDDCDNSFIPTSPNQKQCPECKQRKRKS